MIDLEGSWLVRAEAWALLGVGLAVAEVFTGTMVALALGGAALSVAGLLWTGLVESWQGALLAFGVLGVVVALALRAAFRRAGRSSDVNDY